MNLTLRELAKSLFGVKPVMIHKDLERCGHLIKNDKKWQITLDSFNKGLFTYREYEEDYPPTVIPTDLGIEQIMRHYDANELSMYPLYEGWPDGTKSFNPARLIKEVLSRHFLMSREEMILIKEMIDNHLTGNYSQVHTQSVNDLGNKVDRAMNPHTLLTAHRGDDDEPHRLIRIAKALGIIEQKTGERDLPLGLHDHKGNLSVNWRSVSNYQAFHKAAHGAWDWLDGCDMVSHYVVGKPYQGDDLETTYPGSAYPDCLTVLKKATQNVPNPYNLPHPLTINERLVELDAAINAAQRDPQDLLKRFRAKMVASS